jgi:hypothetical protein
MDEVIMHHCAIRISWSDYFTGFDRFIGWVRTGVAVIMCAISLLGFTFLGGVVVLIVEGVSPDPVWVGYLLGGLTLVMLALAYGVACYVLIDCLSLDTEMIAMDQWIHDRRIFAEYGTP